MIEWIVDPALPPGSVFFVPSEVLGEDEVAVAPFPMFEGKPVDAATLKVATGTALEIDDEVVRMDDVVTIQIEAVVEQVDHRVHRASGRLIRYQVARPVSARVVPRE